MRLNQLGPPPAREGGGVVPEGGGVSPGGGVAAGGGGVAAGGKAAPSGGCVPASCAEATVASAGVGSVGWGGVYVASAKTSCWLPARGVGAGGGSGATLDPE
jgi:hypothetical protein